MTNLKNLMLRTTLEVIANLLVTKATFKKDRIEYDADTIREVVKGLKNIIELLKEEE